MIKKNRGFSLIESLVYVAIVGIIISAVAYFLADVFKTYDKAQAKKTVLNNLNLALNYISNEIKYSNSIYTPTSVFATSSGQISLQTSLNLPADHTATYVDFYLDNGVIYEKREGALATPITSDRVFVTKLLFEKITSTTTKDSIKTTISGKMNTQAQDYKNQANTSVSSTDSLRGYY